MIKSKIIQPIHESYLIGIEKYNAGYWVSHEVNDSGLIGYAVVIGIIVVSFFTVVFFS